MDRRVKVNKIELWIPARINSTNSEKSKGAIAHSLKNIHSSSISCFMDAFIRSKIKINTKFTTVFTSAGRRNKEGHYRSLQLY